MNGSRGFLSLKDFKIPFCDELNCRFVEHGLTPDLAARKICSVNRSDAEDKFESRVNAFKQHLVAYSMFNKPKPEYWHIWFGNMDGYDDFCSRYEQAKEDYRRGYNYFDGRSEKCNDVWNIPTVSQYEKNQGGNHPTVKPLSLCKRAILTSCPEEGIVLDLFGGSGSTLIACEHTNRVCKMMEISPD